MTEAEIRKVVSGSPLLRGLTQALIDEVLQALELQTAPAKSVLFHQGDPARELILLGSGAVKVWQMGRKGDAATIRIMGPGDVIGAVPVFRQLPYPATATTLTDCLILSWPIASVLAFTERCPAIRANALQYVGGRTEELVNRLREMATERVDQRIAHTLLRLADQAGRASVPGGIEIAFPLSRQDIAELVGTDLYTVSRVLRGWAERGFVHASRLRVVLLNRAALERIANGEGSRSG